MESPDGASPRRPLIVAVVLFPEFELLDVAAPGELLGADGAHFRLIYCAEHPETPVRSSCMQLRNGAAGPSWVATHRLVLAGQQAKVARAKSASNESGDGDRQSEEAPVKEELDELVPDVVLVPGGKGVRQEVNNAFMKEWLKNASSSPQVQVIFSVCTGSWLLGAAGALDGKRATSNKAALAAGRPQAAAPAVEWVTKARWVEHFVEPEEGGTEKKLFLTSSGVSAGGDAALALIAHVSESAGHAEAIARDAEWTWHRDSANDPFALGE
jgi:putative intracellular protease/amidase